MWVRWVSIAARVLSLVAASRGYSLVAVHGLLIAVASLVAELRLLACRFQQLQHAGILRLMSGDRRHILLLI